MTDRVWTLIAKKLTGNASAKELKELNELLNNDPVLAEKSQIIENFFYESDRENKNEETNIAFDRLWKKIKYRQSMRSCKKQNGLNQFLKTNLMFKNYFKIPWRSLQKQKIFTFINVFGLSVGIACFSMLLLYTGNEFSFDEFHKNAANIYRPYEWDRLNGGHSPIGYTDVAGKNAASLGAAMKQELPDVINYTRLQLPNGENVIRYNDKIIRSEVTWTDASFFSIFTFPLQNGSKASALRDLNDIVLTASRARQLFGNEDPVGKTVYIQIGTAFQPFTVSAVTKDVPGNSTIRFDVLGNFSFAQKNQNSFIIGNNWHPTVLQTYVQLKPGSTLPNDPKRLSQFIQTYNPDFVANTNDYIANMQREGVAWNNADLPVSFRLQSLLSIHTDTEFNAWGFTDFAKINPKVIWILLAIASGVLLIACINFTTLAIGRSAGRAKEVGVRKVIGADKQQVIFQFLTEALLLSLVSALLGLVLTALLLPSFNQLTGSSLDFSLLLSPKMILLLAGTILAAGLLAGSYPAFILSRFRPIEVLKNKIRIGGSNLFTKSLVTFQFALSTSLIIATIIILQQTKYMINKDPGFNKENVVAIDASQTDPDKIFTLFKQEVLQSPGIVGVTSAAAGLGAGQDFLGFSDKGLSADINVIDTDYLRVLGMQLIAGENLRPTPFNDSLKPIIINETMMHNFGWNVHNVIGKEIQNFQGRTAIVEGVVKNFNYRSLSEEVKNQVFETTKDKGYVHLYVRIAPGNPKRALAAIQKAWRNVAPGIPMKFSFLDEDISDYYKSEQTWSNIIAWAGGISILLACMGLLGLAALAAVNRIKEIGVRKVLGASIRDIIALLSKDFLKLIVIAFIIASPVAYYFMHQWLQDYANRIGIEWWVFAIVGTGVVLIALITISFQSIKAAIANPVKSLRTE
jgi:putative ABC transport system permease protein